MRVPALSRRVLVGGVAAASLIATAALSFGADPATGCAATDPAGDAQIMGSDPTAAEPPGPDGDVDITNLAIAGDATGLTGQLTLVALQDFTTQYFFGDEHELLFTANGKRVVLRTSRFFDPISGEYPATGAVTVDGTAATAASYKVVYDVMKSTITYSVSAADLKTLIGAEPTTSTLTLLAATTSAKLSPQGQTDVTSDSAAAAATAAYKYGTTGCSVAPAPAASGSASGTPSGSPSASGSPSGSPGPSASASATATGSPSSTPTATGSPAAGTQMTFSGPTRVQFGDPFSTLVTLKNSAGQPLSGKKVTGKHGSSAAVSATTNSSGQARLTVTAKDRSGTRNLVVSFAGDSSSPAKTLNRAITTVNEVTKLRKTVSGSGSTRTVTVQLVDDDATAKALVGRNVIFQYSGRTVTLRTDSTGRAKVTAKTGAAMDITFTGETGTYAPAKIRTFAK